MAERLNFRAARRAPSFPPKSESLNILVTAFTPRRKCTWKPCVCFFARALVSMRRMLGSESGLDRLRMSFCLTTTSNNAGINESRRFIVEGQFFPALANPTPSISFHIRQREGGRNTGVVARASRQSF